MRTHILLLAAVCVLSACDDDGRQNGTTKSDKNGVVTLHSTYAVDAKGMARFDCLASSSGQCHYVVFVDNCGLGAHDPQQCAIKEVQRFTLAAKGSRQLAWAAGVQQCVSAEPNPAPPSCGHADRRVRTAHGG